ncbi:hypothetical protein IT575_06600 [bacterium]|nr:hypothetical protein [bacterium]
MSLKHALRGLLPALCSLIALLGLAACPGKSNPRSAPTDAAGQASSEADPAGEQPLAKRELIKDALSGSNEDERQFALLFILRFKLQEFRSLLEPQAVDDHLAAVVLDSLSGDGKASLAWQDRYAGPQAQARWFGAVYGFENASEFPADFWFGALKLNEEKDVTNFCMGMARLDYEPGGPLQRSPELAALLEQHYSAAQPSDVLRRFAIDSLLGTDGGRSIDFEAYLSQPALINTAPSQWAGLLRHAPIETWNSILSRTDLPDVQRSLLLTAAAQIAPPGLSYPGKLRKADAGSAGAAELALLYADKQIERFPLKQIETLKQYQSEIDASHKKAKAEDDKGESGDEDAKSAALKRIQELQELSQGVIAEMGLELSLACMRRDKAAVAYALQQAPFLPEAAAGAVLSTVSRFGRDLAGDEELAMLSRLGNRSLSYYLVLDWGGKAPVLDSDVRRQLLTSPNSENVMLGQAYGLWLKAEGLMTDG